MSFRDITIPSQPDIQSILAASNKRDSIVVSFVCFSDIVWI